MKWSQFVRLLDAIGFPRARSEMWADWTWEHFGKRGDDSFSGEQVVLAIGYIMRGKKAEAVREIETGFSQGERP